MATLPRPIHALTFDLWDTLVVDDSDEPIRAARGLLSKDATRRAGFSALVAKHQPYRTDAEVTAAYERGVQQFRYWWKVEHHTPPVVEWLQVGLDALGIVAPAEVAALAHELAHLEVEIPPAPVPNIHAFLDAVYGKVPLAIVSDTINTPADGLRDILRQHDLYKYFSVFAFSDEVGASKPAAAGFVRVAEALGIEASTMVHFGDRQETDIDGIQRVGGRAVLYTGAIDRHGESHTADLVCNDYAHLLPDLLRLGDFA